MLNIKKANDPSGLLTVDNDGLRHGTMCVCIYGHPGVGKSSLAATAAAPLLLDFDGGVARTGNMRCDSARINQASDITELSTLDLTRYNTIIIDTIGTALDIMGSQFVPWLKSIREVGKDVLLVAAQDEEWFDATGRNRPYILDEIYSHIDLIGHLSFGGDKRLLEFSPSETSIGKNPTNVTIQEVPNGRSEFMGGIIRSVSQDLANRSLIQ